MNRDHLRMCIVKRWIPRQFITDENGEVAKSAGNALVDPFTNKWTDDFEVPAWFHTWGIEGDEGQTRTVGIVEYNDGTVVVLDADKIKFTY
jgi:hypothetical protein